MADVPKETGHSLPIKPTEEVFALPELVENILKFLPIDDLFVFQRVNSTFHDTIKESKAIRQVMHLELAEGDDASDPTTDLFARARHDDYTFTSRAVEFAIEPLQLGYRGTIDGIISINCDTTHDWYRNSEDKNTRHLPSRTPIVKSIGSWRKIKLGWKQLPILVWSRYQRDVGLHLHPMATLGELVDEFSKEWTAARKHRATQMAARRLEWLLEWEP